MFAKFSHEDCFVGTVTVGERGQLVIPAEARRKLGINTGDRLLLMSHPSHHGFMVFKIEALRDFLNYLTAGLSVAEAGEAAARSEERRGDVEEVVDR